MAQYATLEEAYGDPWSSSRKEHKTVVKEMDVHSSQKTYNSPTRRTEAELDKHSKLIQDTLKSLPIGDDLENNYNPAKFASHSSKNQIEPFSVFEYKQPEIPGTADFAYVSGKPETNQVLHFNSKIDKVIRLLESKGAETTSTHDLLLYIFTGIFALFVLDSFVQLGKNSRR